MKLLIAGCLLFVIGCHKKPVTQTINFQTPPPEDCVLLTFDNDGKQKQEWQHPCKSYHPKSPNKVGS
jgi:hypothetical protein